MLLEKKLKIVYCESNLSLILFLTCARENIRSLDWIYPVGHTPLENCCAKVFYQKTINPLKPPYLHSKNASKYDQNPYWVKMNCYIALHCIPSEKHPTPWTSWFKPSGVGKISNCLELTLAVRLNHFESTSIKKFYDY